MTLHSAQKTAEQARQAAAANGNLEQELLASAIAELAKSLEQRISGIEHTLRSLESAVRHLR
jgi:phage shock protein A